MDYRHLVSGPFNVYLANDDCGAFENTVLRAGYLSNGSWRYENVEDILNLSFRVKRLAYEANSWLDHLNRYFSLTGKVSFCLSPSDGFASKSILIREDRFVIVISYPFFEKLYTLFRQLFAQTATYRWLLEAPISGRNDWPFESLEEASSSNLEGKLAFPHPFAEMSWRYAVEFVIAHEFIHIRNGHLSYLSALNSHERGDEDIQGTGPPELLITRRTLEFDADAVSTNLCSDSAKIRTLLGFLPNGTPIIVSQAQSLRLFTHALYSLFKYCYRGEVESNIWNGTHPPAWLRLQNIDTQLITLWRLTKNQAERYFDVITTPALRAFVESTGGNILDELIFNVQSADTSHSYLVRILARWAKIRPELETRKLAGELAPASQPPA